MDIIDKTKALRAEAWQAVVARSEYKAFKGLDDAVRAMTGDSDATVGMVVTRDRPRPVKAQPRAPVARVTQADVAAMVLRRHGEPLPVGRWLEQSIEQGIDIKGDDPLPNFRSMVSRNPRFRNFVRNNMYFWWFSDADLPESWKEATDPDLPGLSAASDSYNQEGGDSHAATIAELTS